MSLKLPPDKQAVTAFYWNKDPTGIFLSSILHPRPSTLTLDLDSLSSPWIAWTLDSLAFHPGQPGHFFSYFTLDPQPWAWTLTACLHPRQRGFTLDIGQPGFNLDPGHSGHPELHLWTLHISYQKWRRLIQKQDSVITEIIPKPDLKKYDSKYLKAIWDQRANLISLGISIQLNVSL